MRNTANPLQVRGVFYADGCGFVAVGLPVVASIVLLLVLLTQPLVLAVVVAVFALQCVSDEASQFAARGTAGHRRE